MTRMIATLRMALLAGTLAAACAPPPPFQPSPELTERAEALTALEARVQSLGALPAAEIMLEDARLITPASIGGFEVGLGHDYPSVGGGRLAPRRDTVRGPANVRRWILMRQREHPGPTPFHFATTRILGCEGAVLQYGNYPVRSGARLGGAETRRPFTAIWRIGPDDELRLESLWMEPPGGAARPGVLARGCRAAGLERDAVRFAGRRLGLQAFAGAGYGPAGGSVGEGFEEGGWDRELEVSRQYPRLGVQGYYRVHPAWNLTGIVTYDPGFSVKGRPGAVGFVPTLSAVGFAVGALAVREVGSLRLGAGPELVYTSWDWSERLLHATIEPGEPSSGSSWTPGVVFHAGLVRPLWSNLYLDLAGRYRVAGNSGAPGFRDLDGLEAQMSAGTVTIGLGRWW
jgi:hypothetical protein